MLGSFGPRYLGFLLPYDLLWRQGARDREPGRGACTWCGEHREHVYIRWDGKPYCRYCIHAALSRPALTSQGPSPAQPVERVWESVASQSGRDTFKAEFWNRQFA